MSNTPVPDDFKITWSFSSLSTYKLCPYKYWAEKIGKTAPWETNEKAEWGTAVHEALENYVGQGTPLPGNMVQYNSVAEKVAALASKGEAEVEKRMAVTREGKETGWFSADAYGRAIADVYIGLGETDAVIIDYKTGKHYGPTDQAVINAKLAMDINPKLEQVKTSFVYLHAGVNEKDTFTRDTIEKDFEPVQEDLHKLEESVKHENFPARKNFLCRQYCTNFACPYNGRR